MVVKYNKICVYSVFNVINFYVNGCSMVIYVVVFFKYGYIVVFM